MVISNNKSKRYYIGTIDFNDTVSQVFKKIKLRLAKLEYETKYM